MLTYDPSERDRRIEAEFHGAIKVVMIHMLLADGDVADAEVRVLTEVLEAVTRKTVDADLIRQQIDSSAVQQRDPAAVAAEVAPYLNTSGKEMVLRAAISVAVADGRLDRQEEALLGRLGDALELSRAHRKGLMLEYGVESSHR